MRSVDRRRLLVPRQSGEILDFASRIYQQLAIPMLKLTLAPLFLAFVGLVFITNFVWPNVWATRNPTDLGAQVLELMFSLSIGFAVAFPILCIGLGYATATTTSLISNYIQGQEVDLEGARSDGYNGGKVMATLIFGIFIRAACGIIFAGAILFLSALLESASPSNAATLASGSLVLMAFAVGVIILPIILGAHSLAPVAAIVENVKAKEAYRRSQVLLKATSLYGGKVSIPSGYLTIFSVGLISVLMWFLISVGMQTAWGLTGLHGFVKDKFGASIFGQAILEGVAAVPTFVCLWLLVPYITCCLVTLYFDRRVRIEALDIEMLAHDVLESTEDSDLRL